MELHPRSLSLSLSGTAAVRHDRRASMGGDVDGGSSVCSVGSNTSLRIVEHRFRAYPLVKKNPTRHPKGTSPHFFICITSTVSIPTFVHDFT